MKQVFGGISIKVNRLIVAVLGLSLLFVGCGSAIEHGTMYGHPDDHNLNHGDRDWNHNGYDWLSGGYYLYPSTYYYNYYTPMYTYTYPTYYYTEPVYYNTPIVYHNSYLDPWWGANIYGFGSTYYYSSSSHWTYNGGYGFGYP
jgi:hypothetical protein